MTDQRANSGNLVAIGVICHFFSVPLLFLIVGGQYCTAQEPPSALSGFESSEIFDVQDGQTLKDYREVLFRLLYRVSFVSDSSLLDFSRHTNGVELNEVLNDPRDYRFYVFELRGRAKMVQQFPLDQPDDDLPFSGYSLTRVVGGNDTEVVVATPLHPNRDKPPAIPASWPRNEEIDEPVMFRGFFAALADFTSDDDDASAMQNFIGLSGDQALLFVAGNLGWFPESGSSGIPVKESQLLLARHGVAAGHLEAFGTRDSAAIGPGETDVFYQMLSATRQISPADLPENLVNFTDLLQNPRKHHGDAVAVSGNVKRITRILINDQAVRKRYGMDHYYQMDLFVPLDNQEIVIRPPKSDSGAVTDESAYIRHENRYPVTVHVATLPASISEIERRQVVVHGFFFKLWNYESELTQQKKFATRQLSPLIIGLTPQILELPPDYISYLIGAGCLVFISGLGLLIWYLKPRSESPSGRSTTELPDRIEIAEN